MIPPRAVDKACAWTVHAHQLDEGLGVCIPGTWLLHLTCTTTMEEAEASKVATKCSGGQSILEGILKGLIYATAEPICEIWGAEFALPRQEASVEMCVPAQNIHITRKVPPSIYLHDALEVSVILIDALPPMRQL